MFGNVVHGIEGEKFEDEIKRVKADRGVKHDTELDVDALRELTEAFKGFYDVPDRPARAARAGDPRRLRLLERRPRAVLPAHQPHPRRLGHRGQRPADGLRQQGRHERQRRGVQPRRGHRRARAQRRLPHQRPGRGRRQRRAQHPRHLRARVQDARGPRAADGDPAHAREALRGHAGHGVHRGGGAALHAPDAQRQAPGAGRGALRRRRGRARGCSTRPARWRRSTPDSLDALLHPTFDPDAEFDVLATGVAASPGAAKGEIVFTAKEAVLAAADGRDVILVRPFTEADDVAGFHAAKGILTSRGRQGQPRGARRARHGRARGDRRATWRSTCTPRRSASTARSCGAGDRIASTARRAASPSTTCRSSSRR